jgi:hypothetical protein
MSRDFDQNSQRERDFAEMSSIGQSFGQSFGSIKPVVPATFRRLGGHAEVDPQDVRSRLIEGFDTGLAGGGVRARI